LEHSRNFSIDLHQAKNQTKSVFPFTSVTIEEEILAGINTGLVALIADE
jgi:hypothetical protein